MQKFLSVFEKILFFYGLLLLAFIPLYPKFPLLNVKGTFVAIRLEDFLLLSLVLFWGIFIYISKKIGKVLQDKVNQLLILFFFVGLLSLFSAYFVTHTVISNLAILHYLRRIEFMVLLPIYFTITNGKKDIKISMYVLGLALFIINVYALGQKYLGWPVISTGNSEFSKGLILYLTPGARVNSTFAGHYDLAVFLAMCLTFLSALFFLVRKIYQKFLILALGIFSGVILIMTAARLSFVAMIVGILTVLILLKKKSAILILVLLMFSIFIYPSQLRDRFVSTITINLLHQGERYSAKTDEQRERSALNIPTLQVRTSSNSAEASKSDTASGNLPSDITPGEPLDTTDLGVYRSFGIRLNQEWPRALTSFIKNPLLGTGYSSLGLATDNDFLRTLGEVGILGTLSFFLIIFTVSKRIWKIYRNEDGFVKVMSVGSLAIIAAFLINALFIDVFEASKVAALFWMFLGISLSLEKLKQ